MADDAEKKIDALRAEIDRLDAELLALLERRAAAAQEIGALKGRGPAYRPEREAEILNKVSKHAGILPAERIVFTGDFFEGRPGAGVLSYLGDAFIDEWPASLERLKALDFDIIVPGHGAPLKERQQITDYQNYLRDFWRQARTLRLQGVTAEQAAQKMDMSKFAAQYGLKNPRPDPRAVLRAYELLQIQMPM